MDLRKNLGRHRYFHIILIISLIIFLDQLTKYLAIKYLQPLHSVTLLGNFLRLTYVENTGMAFGIEIDNKLFFNVLSIIAVFIIFFYLFRLRAIPLLRISFAIILGGAFGNLIDRFSKGRVVDFLDVEFFDLHFPGGQFLSWDLPAYSMYRWPVFNVADIAVSIGMCIIIITAFLQEPLKPAPENAYQKDI